MASQSASRGQGAETRQPGRRNPRDLHESDFYSRSKKREREKYFSKLQKKKNEKQTEIREIGKNRKLQNFRYLFSRYVTTCFQHNF